MKTVQIDALTMHPSVEKILTDGLHDVRADGGIQKGLPDLVQKDDHVAHVLRHQRAYSAPAPAGSHRGGTVSTTQVETLIISLLSQF